MSGILYVVATPIGNLEDVTLRALRVLREVAVIAAEDTRRTGRLLQHFAITTPTVSYHEHSGAGRLHRLLERLESGDSVALVSDAGTPGVSDPGFELIREARMRGIKVEPVPGASAVLAAMVASGFPMDRFAVRGFPPSRSKARKEWLSEVCTTPTPVVFFEAPHRVRDTLADLAIVCGVRPIVIGRELTKMHEEFSAGTATELLERFKEPIGEFTIVLGPAPPAQARLEPPTDAEITGLFWRKTEKLELSRREAINAVASDLRLSPNAVYQAIERHKLSGIQNN